jgi:hypothetical protein
VGHDGQGQATLPKRRSLVHLVIFHGAVTVPCHYLLWLCGRRVGCRWDQRVTRRFRIGRAPMMFGFVQSWWTKILRLHRDRRSRHSVIVTKQANDGIKTTRPRLNVTTTTTGERTGRVNGLEYNASGTSSRLPRSTEIPRARRSTANPREPPGSVRRGNGPFGPCVCVAGRKTTSPGIVKAPSGRKTKKVGRGVSLCSIPNSYGMVRSLTLP